MVDHPSLIPAAAVFGRNRHRSTSMYGYRQAHGNPSCDSLISVRCIRPPKPSTVAQPSLTNRTRPMAGSQSVGPQHSGYCSMIQVASALAHWWPSLMPHMAKNATMKMMAVQCAAFILHAPKVAVLAPKVAAGFSLASDLARAHATDVQTHANKSARCRASITFPSLPFRLGDGARRDGPYSGRRNAVGEYFL